MATVSVALVIGFQLASTALTTTLKAAPAVWVAGVPVFRRGVRGAEVSPGRRIWGCAGAPAWTVMEGLVFAVRVPSSRSVAVNVCLPAVLKVTVKVFVPPTTAALAGRLALLSEPVIP